MNLEQMTYLVEAASHRSITKAAGALYISQSTISMAIANLEKELGFPLFTRSKSGVLPTAQGEYVIARAQRVLAEIQDIRQYAQEYTQKLSGRIRIGAAPLFANSVLVEIIPALVASAPQLQLKLYENHNMGIIDDVVNGRIDLGVIGYTLDSKSVIIDSLKKQCLSYEKIHTCSMSFYLHCRHPLLQQVAITLADIALYPVVLHENLAQSIRALFEGYTATVIEVHSYESLQKMLCHNDIVGVIPDLAVLNEYYISSAQIVRLAAPAIAVQGEYAWVHQARGVVTAPEKKIMDMTREYLRGQDRLIQP